MTPRLTALLLILLTTACVHTTPPNCQTGDANWSRLKNRCVALEREHDLHLEHRDAYIIFSEDKMYAELFHAGQNPIILESVKGGYVSVDGKTRLQYQNDQWRLIQN